MAKDLDRNGSVDGIDYAMFQPCMSGSGVAAPASCTNGTPPSGTFTLHGLPADVLPDGHVLIFARARHYHPTLGRWLQRDPLGYIDGPNLYEAFGGNPLTNSDPMGMAVMVVPQLMEARDPSGNPAWVVQYTLIRNGFDVGWLEAIFSNSYAETRELVGVEYFPYSDASSRQRMKRLATRFTRFTADLLEQSAKAGDKVQFYERSVVLAGTLAVAIPTAGLAAPMVGTWFSTTTVGMTQTTLLGNMAAASLTTGVSWGLGQSVGVGLAGGDNAAQGLAFVEGFAVWGTLGAPLGMAAPVGLAPGFPLVEYPAISANVQWNNGWRTPDGRFASLQGSGRAGASAEEAVWGAIEAKPGWTVIRGRVYARDPTGQVRVYDGVAISPNRRVIGIEVKSGTGRLSPEQRAFDARLNSDRLNTAEGIGQHDDIIIERAIEVQR